MKIHKTTQRKKERTVELIQALIPVFAQMGIDKPRFVDLSNAIQRNAMVLQRHFGDKEGIILHCAAYARRSIQNGLNQIIKKHLNDLDNLPAALLNYMNENLDICRFLIQIMAHPIYAEKINDSSLYINDQLEQWTKEENAMEKMPEGVAYLLNSVINDYGLKRNEKVYFSQMKILLDLMKSSNQNA